MSQADAGARPPAPASPVARLPAPVLNGIGSALLLALAAWLWAGASDIDGAGQGLVGPDGFPRLVAVLLGGASLLLMLGTIRDRLRGRGQATIQVPRPLAVLAAIVLVGCYPLLITAIGYYPATAVWMIPFLLLAGMRNPAGIVASTAGFLLFTKVLFQMILGTPLP